MPYDLLHLFAELVTFAAGVAFGLSWLIAGIYWHIFRNVRNGQRLLPLHVLAISSSYAMLAFIAVARLGDPPPPYSAEGWWVYPLATLAFLVGDFALVLILRFVARRGPRYRTHDERRS